MEPFDRDPRTPGEGRPDGSTPETAGQTRPLLPPPPAPPGAWGSSRPLPGMYGDSGPMPTPWNAPVREPVWKRVVVPLLVTALVGGVISYYWANKPDSPNATPTEWDERVLPIADFVAQERDLGWLHPVAVDFLPEADFVALFSDPGGTTAAPTLDETDRRANEQLSELYNAKGLAVSYDPGAATTTVQEVTTLGFYSPGTDHIYVRGNELTPAVRVVLAHELTHALQGQHFDLKTARPNDLEFRAIVEADALRVENVYRDTLSPDEQQQADGGNTMSEDAATELDAVPWALVEMSYAPYVLGPSLVDTVFAERGNEGINRLISAPPTEEVLLSPWLFGSEQPRPTIVLVPPADSESVEDTRLLSPVEMLIMLDAWLPFAEARAALDGWGNGSYAAYDTAAGPVCFAAKAAFDDVTAATLFRDTVIRWGEAMGSPLFPSLRGETVEFESCDRGPTATPTPEPVVPPMLAISLEHDAVSLAGTDPSDALVEGYRCFAATLIDDPAAAPLLASNEAFSATQQATFDTLTDAAAAACGVPPLER
ncbi:MAG: hypothetical protein ABMA25_03750 [Ilumatobacteraceae bacterium]